VRFQGPGGDDSCRLVLCLILWQVGEPFLDEFVAERPHLVQDDGEFCWTVVCQ
jgi:hypothetical protein